MFCALDTFRGPKFVPVGRLRLLGRFWKKAWRDEKWMLNMTCKSNGKRCKQRSSKIISILRSPTSIKKHHQSSIVKAVYGQKLDMKSHAKSIPALQHRFELKRWPHMPLKCLSQSAPRVLTSERISDATSLVALLRYSHGSPSTNFLVFFLKGLPIAAPRPEGQPASAAQVRPAPQGADPRATKRVEFTVRVGSGLVTAYSPIDPLLSG